MTADRRSVHTHVALQIAVVGVGQACSHDSVARSSVLAGAEFSATKITPHCVTSCSTEHAGTSLALRAVSGVPLPDKGKPVTRRGRKATGQVIDLIAGLSKNE
jgi:hypothetical protein